MSHDVNVFDTNRMKAPDRAPNARLRRNARLEKSRPRVLEWRARLAGAVAFGLRVKIAKVTRLGSDRPRPPESAPESPACSPPSVV
jgi:hypothetical protein